MHTMDYEPADTSGNIRSIEVLGIDAMGQCLVVDIEVGRPDAPKGIRAGKWTIPLEVARELFVDLAIELQEHDDAQPTTPQ
jgi:hypothetical protein